MTAQSDVGGVALILSDVVKKMGRRTVLAGASTSFRLEELTLIRGIRGSGKSVLARLIAGQILPDSGTVNRLGPAAPLIGAAWGFTAEAPVLQGLELRAASYGLALKPYADKVLSLLDDPDARLRSFNRLAGRDRQLLLYASAYLIPSTVYVADGALLPGDRDIRKRLGFLLAAARASAAVIWIANEKVKPRDPAPDRLLRLENGVLHPDDGAWDLAPRERPDEQATAVADEDEE